MGIDSVGGSNRSSTSYSSGSGGVSSTSKTPGNTAAASEVAKAQTANTATPSRPQVDFNTSSFSITPQTVSQAMQPSPVAQRAELQQVDFTADLFDPNPMGPPSTFQGNMQTPVGAPTDTFAPVTAPIPPARPEGLGTAAPVTAPIPQPRPADLGTAAPVAVPIPQPRPANLGATAAPAAAGNIQFGTDARPEAVSDFSRQVLSDVMAQVGVTDLRITSTARTPEAQARAMYTNLENQGVASQRRLYGAGGDQVIDAYEEARAAGMDREGILQAMVDRINEVGPSSVSRHLANPTERNIIDISPRSIPAHLHDAFQEALRNHPDVSRFLGPADGDPAFHVEIAQPGVGG
jgi:hypothetical protein